MSLFSFNPDGIRLFKNHRFLILLLLAITLGFLFRIIALSSINFYFDESVYAVFAKNFVENNISPWLGSAVQPPLFTWINSIPVYMLGVSEFSVRLPSAIFGTLSIVLVYFLAKIWYGRRTAILSAFLLAVMPLHVLYSRLAFNDVIQTFFILAAVLIAEYVINGDLRYEHQISLIIVSGIMFSLSYLVKYNVIVVWVLYWIFNIGYALIQKNKIFLRKYLNYTLLSSLVAGVFIIVTICLTDGIPALVYLLNSTLFWISFQYTQVFNPFYYYFLVLFDSLSPLIYVWFLASIIYLVIYKQKKRSDYLLLFLVLFYLIIISFQTRRLSKYLILILPFIVILLSVVSIKLVKYFKSSKKFYSSSIFILFIFFSGALWSVYEINKEINFRVWSEAGTYINTQYPADVTIHGSFHKNRLVRYYLQESADNSEFIGTLKNGDLVVFTWLNNSSTILENSPFEDKSIFFDAKHTEYNEEFIDYVKKHGKLVKTFNYKGRTAFWLYEIKSTGPHKEDKVKKEYLVRTSLFGIWYFVCNQWGKDSLTQKIMYKLLSEEQIGAINIKCITKSYLK